MKTTLLVMSLLFLACTADAAEPQACARLKPGLLIGDVYSFEAYLDLTDQNYIGIGTDGGMANFLDLYPAGGNGDVGDPAWVYIQFPTLDSRAGSTPQYIVDGIYELVGRVEADFPGAAIYVSTIPPVKDKNGQPLTGHKLALWEATNQLILERGGYDFSSFDDAFLTIGTDTGCAVSPRRQTRR